MPLLLIRSLRAVWYLASSTTAGATSVTLPAALVTSLPTFLAPAHANGIGVAGLSASPASLAILIAFSNLPAVATSSPALATLLALPIKPTPPK